MCWSSRNKKLIECYKVAEKDIPVRKVIASKIDLCTDRNEHLDVLEWKEYKENYAPMTKKEYESKMKAAKENYEATVLRIEKEYKEKGVNSPDYHKV